MKILRAILILILILNSLSCANTKNDTKNGKPLQEERAYYELRKHISQINVEEEIAKKLKMEPVYLSLDECIEIALRNNFEIQSAMKLFESAKYEYQNSLAKLLPNAGINGYVRFINGQVLVGDVLVDDFTETAIAGYGYIVTDLTKGGVQIFLSKSAKRIERARNHQSKGAKGETLRETAKNYYRLLDDKLNIEVWLMNYYEREAQLENAKVLHDVGSGTRVDVLRCESELTQAEQSLLEAFYNFKYTQARLANIIGIEVSTPIMPIETKAKLIGLVDEKETVDDLYNIALANRENLKAKTQEIESLKQLKYATYADFIPKISAGVQWGKEGTVSQGVRPNSVVSLMADIPIGQNLGVGTITKAKAQQKQIEAKMLEYKQLQYDIKEGIINAYYGSIAGKEREKVGRKQIEYTAESVRMAEVRFRVGEGTLIDVIQAQNLNTASRLQYIHSIIQYNINQIDLLFESGMMSPANVLQNYTP